jgi:ATP-dependent phosphoenolpyruvate carboxykinase
MIMTKNTENIIFINLSSCQGLFKQTKFGSEKNSPVSEFMNNLLIADINKKIYSVMNNLDFSFFKICLGLHYSSRKKVNGKLEIHISNSIIKLESKNGHVYHYNHNRK